MWTMPWNALWDLLVRYDGLDWVATVASLASIYYLGDGRRAGFTLGMLGAVLWCVFGVLVGSIAGALLNALLFLLFLRGYRKWEARRDPSAFGPSA
jgi:hypothetical protein